MITDECEHEHLQKKQHLRQFQCLINSRISWIEIETWIIDEHLTSECP